MTLFRISFLLLVAALTAVSCSRKKEEITWSGHVAEIIYTHCTTCHRPGSAGTFNLLTYEDARNKAGSISLVTRARLMPPYPADPSYSHFRNEKVLSEQEIEWIKEWADQGAPPGDLLRAPKPPEFAEGSMAGKPDLVLHMKKAFAIEGNNADHFMMMKIPFELPNDTFIRAIEIVPGNRKLVHHINAHLVVYENGAKKDLHKGETVVNTELMDKREAYERLDLQNDDGTYPLLITSVSNYLPGLEPSFYPEGIGGYRVRRKCVLLLDNIHYGPSPVDDTDSTTFNVFFDAVPPKRPVGEFILGTSGISPVIPPLVVQPNTILACSTQYTLPRDLSLLTLNAHMHLLGKSFLAYAVGPGGDTIPLLRIPAWDFRWQYIYTFPKMLKLEKGSTLFVKGEFDNTPANPLNPFQPPRIIAERSGSMRTTDEMFQLIVNYVPYVPGDEEKEITGVK